MEKDADTYTLLKRRRKEKKTVTIRIEKKKMRTTMENKHQNLSKRSE